MLSYITNYIAFLFECINTLDITIESIKRYCWDINDLDKEYKDNHKIKKRLEKLEAGKQRFLRKILDLQIAFNLI